MAVRRTLEFLPSIFQSDTNKKFLSATLDQLVTEPEYTRLNGYIGRTFAPTYKSTDSYVIENSSQRQNYQLEPSLVIKDSSKNVDFYSSYTDIVNKISYYGGLTSNHDRLFSSEYYAYNNLIDQDKFVNFSQYYWLPNGPRPVEISSENVVSQRTFTLVKDPDDRCYRVNDLEGDNPEIVLARGGNYKFKASQPGSKLWIQTEPGISGYKRAVPNVSTRDVYGVTNNGVDNGTVEFRVPLVDTQDVYLKMPMQTPVDYAIDLSFTSVDGARWEDIVATYGGFDGVDVNPNSKTVIFLNPSSDAAQWQRFNGTTLAPEHRRGVWRIRFTKDNNNKDIVNLDYIRDVNENNRIYSRLGRTHANKEFYKNKLNQYIAVPALTAQLNVLYYQDEADPTLHGRIRLVDGPTDNIYVDTSIIGKKNYTSPSGVDFTNGMVIKFDSNVEPAKYANNTYIVEGVGTGIRLINFDWLKFPEPGLRVDSVPSDTENWDLENYDEPYKGPADPQYITMNRGSLDLNAWSRQNRWFHIDVILKSAELNNTSPSFKQAIRATRPIIEFEPDIQLIDNGRIGKRPVEHIETAVTDAFNQVQHSDTLTINGALLRPGDRILFPNDKDPLVRSQVYRVQYKIQDEGSYKSYYDGTGTGTITIDAPNLPYISAGEPSLVPGGNAGPGVYDYTWTVNGRPDLLTAVQITGFNFPGNDSGTVFVVNNLGGGLYEILFSTTAPITSVIDGQVAIVGAGGTVSITGEGTSFKSDLKIGTAIYAEDGTYLGIVDGIQNDTVASLEANSVQALDNQPFLYKHPRIQLLISEDADDALEPYDTLVATTGSNKGNSFWYDGTQWHAAQHKTKSTQTPLFDVFDSSQLSFTKYTGSLFTGTKIFSYKVGTGAVDSALGFPLSYTSNSSIADITFNNDFGIDTFKYQEKNVFVTKRVDSGFLRQNTGRYTFSKRNTWTTVNEPSRQYQIISRTYTGRTNHFEIDVLPEPIVKTPTIKVFVNNKKILSSQFVVGKVNARNTVKVSAKILTPGDRVDILIYSKSVSNLGFYQVPINLDYNSKNAQFTTLTLGQLRTNLTISAQNLVDVQGDVPGSSNIRDIDVRAYGGNIIQNSSPLLFSGLFLIHDQANFVSALDYARREYTKFKNKFVELCMSLPGLDPHNPKDGVDLILRSINAVKNKSFPWYYSDMVPFGEADVIRYTVLDEQQRQYKINTIFDDRVPQNRAVLVYHNNHLLIKDRDFYFDKTRPAIQLAPHITTVIDDVIEIKDYLNTDSNYIPETPTKLGLYPKFLPSLEVDDTYRTPVQVIQGHDGSLTPAYGDHRDLYLLELELRIYNNIKLDPAKSLLDVRSFVPGRFRNADYSLREFNTVINRSFMRWAGFNKVDYINNTFFEGNDQFTYNYRKSKDSLFSENLPGYWRGIYQYFYDTDRPHSHPWEMLGFTEKPIWWEDEYGPAPYTSGNAILWEDLEKGLVKQGPNMGTHSKFARPGLSKIIPVDANGDLLPPLAKIATQFSSTTSSESWQVGDGAPAETAWRRTSEYPYALQLAVALMKPAIYFGSMADTTNYFKDMNLGQYVDTVTGQRISPTALSINGEEVNGRITRTTGYVNWISDYLTSLGINGVTKLRGLLNNLEVQLSYKVAGYTDQKYLTVLAEQYSPTSTNNSVIIPDDSYQIHLNKSVPVERIAYSAVVVTKTSTGFAVSGYNTNNPYFTVVPSETAGSSYTVTVDKLTATIYNEYKKQKLLIPYGTEFKTRQQVADFLVSYQRYLFAQGFIFDEYNEDLAKTQDWILSVQEFLTWTMQGWAAGNSIILSPVNAVLKVLSNNSVVDEITNDVIGSKILDPNFNVIKTTEVTTLRDTNLFKVTSLAGKTFSFAELNLVQFEHVLIFDNTTIFNDIIYKPESGSRQYRLKLVGTKTDNWDGSLNPRGFVYNNPRVTEWQPGRDYKKGDLVGYKAQYYVATDVIDASSAFDVNVWKQIDKSEIKTGLLPNFATNASRFIDVYDADSSLLDSQLAKMSSGLIGFRARDYLTDLNVNTTSQTKFYQGYIKEKGTGSAITNLLNAKFNDLGNNVSYVEEWAFRVGEYGATEINRSVEIELDEMASKNNPVGFTIIGNNDSLVDGVINVRDKDLWNRPFDKEAIGFINRPLNSTHESDIQSAGYVNVDDVDATVFDSNNYQLLANKLSDIGSGYIVWAAKDVNKDWNIYRASETDIEIETLSYGLDQAGTVTTKSPHNLKANQIIIIKNFNGAFDGFYKILSAPSPREITIPLTEKQMQLVKKQSVPGPGVIFVLDSVRFDSPSLVGNYTPRHGWKDGDRVWIDRDKADRWAVYEKTSVWNQNGSLDIRLGSTKTEINYGTSVKVDRKGNFVAVGAPGDQNGIGRVHVFDRNNNKERGVLPVPSLIRSLGQSIDINNFYIASGAPDSFISKGAVVIYKYAQETFFLPVQVLRNPTDLALSYFGTSVSMSADSKWLYVGSPGDNKVHYYRLKEFQTNVSRFSVEESARGCVLPYSVTDVDSLAVYVRGELKHPGIDYTFNPMRNRVEFIATDFPDLVSENGEIFITEDGISAFTGELGLGKPVGTVTIIQRSYYDYMGTLSEGSGIDQFGYSVKTNDDGSLLVVGAPGATDLASQAGAAYVYNNDLDSVPELRLQETVKGTNPVYRARFGSSVEICPNSCSLYIGAPGYSDLDYKGGQVHRFVNSGLVFGDRIGTKVNPTVNVGDSFFINGVEVQLTGTSLESVISDINNARILGVRASNVDNKLYIKSNVEVSINKLRLRIGTGTALEDLGIGIFERAQVIPKPIDVEGENFGERLRISVDAETLAVSSTRGTAQTFSVIDSKTTTFDSGATPFLDITKGTGAVYFHDFLENSANDSTDKFGTFVFTEELNAPNLKVGDQFGCAVDFDSTGLYIGASYNDTKDNNAGSVYAYVNPTQKKGWNLVRHQLESIDISGINSVSLYNKITKSKIATLDFIDPVKGKGLGIVEENLNYKSSKDPAMYNAGSSITNGGLVDFHWGKQQLGQTWWNLDTVRYINYEQDTLAYRLNSWGTIFPGSDVAVYEWVESNVLPSAYAESGNVGTPLHPDNSAYVQISYAETGTGIIQTKYYFWVRGITSVDTNSTRTMSVRALENAIINPKAQAIPYAAIMDYRSVALFNCDRYISSNDCILKIDFDRKLNNNNIHSEFELVGENDPNAIIPERIRSKLVDSLSGIDQIGLRVPDARLKPSQNIGLSIRPRQTLVSDRLMALKNVVTFVNSIFSKTTSAYKLQNSRKFSNAYFFAADAEPTDYTHRVANIEERGYVNKTPGDIVLVASDETQFGLWALYEIQSDGSFKLLRNQTYKTPDLWTYANWYADGYDSDTKPDYIVDYLKDLQKISIRPGDVVRVNSTSTGGFEIYKYITKDQSELVGVENGTLVLSDLIWDIENNNVGFDNAGVDEAPFDRDYSREIRSILLGLEKEIFVDDLIENYNKLLFVMINYILTEQQNVDWIFKTSFISVLHKIKELKHYPNFIRDNHSYYEDYINEVKPYRTKIREYKVGYTGMETAGVAVSDFDLPGYWDKDLKRFRSPSTEIPSKDGTLFSQPQYIDWARNFTFGVESITIADPGSSFTQAPQVQIIANGDSGTGATAVAVINEISGKILQIYVTNPGTGYRNTPFVIINGDGTGARAYAKLTNQKIRSIKTVMKFDRVAHNTDVTEWQPDINYVVGQLVSYNGRGYITKVAGANSQFVPGNFTLVNDSEYTTANDRVAATYLPGPNQIPKEFDSAGNIDLTRLIPGVGYLANAVQDNKSVYSETNLPSPRMYETTSADPESINIAGGGFFDQTKSYAPEELVPGTTFDSVNIKVQTVIDEYAYIYRIMKNPDGVSTYMAVSASRMTTLARDFVYGDDKIYLTDIAAISEPDVPLRRPGVVYINGERIKFWEIDKVAGVIKNPIRGLDFTAEAVLHPAGSTVEDQGEGLLIPGTTTVKTARFTYTAKKPIFAPTFVISTTDLETAKLNLEVSLSVNVLEYGKDYTVTLVPAPGGSRLRITFVNASRFADGLKFSLKYNEENIWLNPGSGAVTDGTGLEGANTVAATFVKSFPHNLP